MALPESGDALHDEVIAGERARLVETADLHLPSERNPERLRAVHDWGKPK